MFSDETDDGKAEPADVNGKEIVKPEENNEQQTNDQAQQTTPGEFQQSSHIFVSNSQCNHDNNDDPEDIFVRLNFVESQRL